MNGIAERETRRTGLDGAKSARGRERERDRERERPDQDMQQSLAAALFFTITFIPYVGSFLRGYHSILPHRKQALPTPYLHNDL